MRPFLLFFLFIQSIFAAPNIILIYADDLGYGDVSCNGATAVGTPNIDRIAKEGINFRSGYSTASTCTPSRYSLLTGRYAFRQTGTNILAGDANLIIDPSKPTLPSALQKFGYRTSVVGKWHLGLGADESIDWNKPISPGPNQVGFDFSYIMAATGDRVPCVYVADGKVVNLDPADPLEVSYHHAFPGLPTGITDRKNLRMDWTHGHNNAVVNGIGRIGYMRGGNAAIWKDEEMADVFTGQAVKFINESKDKPFFLFFALHDVHVPRVPHPRFVGKTKMGSRGDSILQADWQVGEILQVLDELKLADDTLVIFSSDNGPVINDGYMDQSVKLLGDHRPAGPFRDGKYSAYEGGTRVPLLARWPGRIGAGKTSDAMISQVDFARTLGKIAGGAIAREIFPDSLDVVSALLGESSKGRDHVVQQGRSLAIRSGDWKLIASDEPQLYHLSEDIAETKNLARENPGKVKELSDLLDRVRE